MSDQILLKVENLKTVFQTENGVVRAVNGIDFELKKGETLGIVGESGSGKSMTALSIMGLVPESGKVTGEINLHTNGNEKLNLLDRSATEMQLIRGKEIAMIFQEPMTSLNPVFSCGVQISEALQFHLKVSKESAEKTCLELFEKVKLPDPERIFKSYPHQLSGGQKQRVMIAMALSCKPKILIADEPTTALDVTVQKSILELIEELKAEFGMSVIFISHDLGVISEIAENVLVMFNGKIVESSRVEEIFKSPKHAYTKSLIACRPPLDLKLNRLQVTEDFLEIIENENGEIDWIEKEGVMVTGIENQLVTKGVQTPIHDDVYSKEPILKVKSLKTWFLKEDNFFKKGKEFIKAVNDVSFDVFPGETLGLVGESGCGKTTLGRTLIKLEKATSGEIIFQGKSVLNMSERDFRSLRKEIQIIFQDPYSSLNPRKIIGHSILEPLKLYSNNQSDKTLQKNAIELLEKVGLEERHFYRMPSEFSGGQRQRICIARALATQPKFIICDECVSSLDVSIQAQILNLLKDLQEKHQLTYIFISHDLSVVKFMSDRMMVMNEGRIEEFGLPEDIYNNPQKEYTRKLIEAIPKGF